MTFLNVMSRGDTPVRGRDGISTPQNGAAAYSQSHVSRTCQGGFPLPSLLSLINLLN